MAIVVSDTSPIRALHFLKQVTLLEQLFGTVIVPPTVAGELAQPCPQFSPIDVSAFANFEIRAPNNQQLVQKYVETIDGEAQAIVLAVELKATLLIDEAAGRAAAAAAGVPYMGVLGVLSLAKREGLISEVRPLLDRLRLELRFRIAQNLYDQFLKSIGEL
jgi:uncharacterized protein